MEPQNTNPLKIPLIIIAAVVLSAGGFYFGKIFGEKSFANDPVKFLELQTKYNVRLNDPSLSRSAAASSTPIDAANTLTGRVISIRNNVISLEKEFLPNASGGSRREEITMNAGTKVVITTINANYQLDLVKFASGKITEVPKQSKETEVKPSTITAGKRIMTIVTNVGGEKVAKKIYLLP